MTVGIMGAMTEEISSLVEAMEQRREVTKGQRTYHQGSLFGREVVVVFSRWGKVAAATTATELISHFGASEILFTGVAGAAEPGLRIGDVVVGSALIQHDLDPTPLFPRHEVPLLGISAFRPSPEAKERALAAVEAFFAKRTRWIPDGVVAEFGIREPRGVEGEIASGDKFFAERAALEELKARLPAVRCVEMEGAAVAQVCHEYGVPLTVVRTISDTADENAPIDFPRFARLVASRYALGIVSEWLQAT